MIRVLGTLLLAFGLTLGDVVEGDMNKWDIIVGDTISPKLTTKALLSSFEEGLYVFDKTCAAAGICTKEKRDIYDVDLDKKTQLSSFKLVQYPKLQGNYYDTKVNVGKKDLDARVGVIFKGDSSVSLDADINGILGLGISNKDISIVEKILENQSDKARNIIFVQKKLNKGERSVGGKVYIGAETPPSPCKEFVFVKAKKDSSGNPNLGVDFTVENVNATILFAPDVYMAVPADSAGVKMDKKTYDASPSERSLKFGSMTFAIEKEWIVTKDGDDYKMPETALPSNSGYHYAYGAVVLRGYCLQIRLDDVAGREYSIGLAPRTDSGVGVLPSLLMFGALATLVMRR